MSLDVRRLRVLQEVAARGSFSAAADALAFTQPAVSRQIATLEAEAGARLVDRTARGIRLTPAGELLVEHADAILSRLAAAETQLEALAGLDAGRLRLGSFPTASATLIPLAIAAFTEAHPGVELRLVESTSEATIQQVAAGAIDIAVVSDALPMPEVPADVVLEHLMDDPLYVALSRDHPLAHAHGAADGGPERRDVDRGARQRVHAAADDGGPRRRLRAPDRLRVGPVARQAGPRRRRRRRDADPDAGARDRCATTSCCARSADAAPSRRVSVATHAWLSPPPSVAALRKILQRVAREHCFSCDAMVAA